MTYMPIFKIQPEMTLGENTAKAKNSKLGFGMQGNLDTIQVMKKVARKRATHPKVRELALRILESHGVQSQNYIDEALAIGRYVKAKVRYVRDINGVEQLHDPLTLIDQIQRGMAHGDCDDMSLLIATLLLSIGHQPYFRIVRYRQGGGPFQHIYVVVYENNWHQKKKRIVLDAILKRQPIGTEVKHISGREIRV
jgi:hypothetical protein